jgi:hypothetical protein
MNIGLVMSELTKGCMFFNFGDKCVMRLLVALYTLRRYYKGPCVVMLMKGDASNERLAPELAKLNVDVQWFDLQKICRRNIKSVLKPGLLRESPYDVTLIFDGDLVFRKSPEELFAHTQAKGFLVTHFNGWWADKGPIRGRVHGLKDSMTAEELADATLHHEAINVGVVGYMKGKGDALHKAWEDLTLKARGKFIVDEIAMQCVFFKFPCFVTTGEWNSSCRNNNELNKAAIVHYHGNKHTSPKRTSSRLWWAELGRLFRENLVDVKYWMSRDPDVPGTFEKNGKWKFVAKCCDVEFPIDFKLPESNVMEDDGEDDLAELEKKDAEEAAKV